MSIPTHGSMILEEIMQISGMDYSHLSIIFAVSPRRIHNWHRGSSMSTPNKKYAQKILDDIKNLGNTTNPSRNLEIILEHQNYTQPSLLEEWARSRPKAQLLHYPPQTAKEQLRG